MSDTEPGDPVSVIAHKIQVHVSEVPGETGHSYSSVEPMDYGAVVTVESRMTYFRYDRVFVFDRYRYVMAADDDSMPDKAEEGHVHLRYPDGFSPEDPDHPFHDAVSLEEFADMLESGSLETAIDPDMDY